MEGLPILLDSQPRNLGVTCYPAFCLSPHPNPVRPASEISLQSVRLPSAHCPSQGRRHLLPGFCKCRLKSSVSRCVLHTGSLSLHVKPPLAPLYSKRGPNTARGPQSLQAPATLPPLVLLTSPPPRCPPVPGRRLPGPSHLPQPGCCCPSLSPAPFSSLRGLCIRCPVLLTCLTQCSYVIVCVTV